MLVSVAGATIILAWCGWSQQQLTFDEAYNNRTDQMVGNTVEMFAQIQSRKGAQEDTSIVLSTDNSFLRADVAMDAVSRADVETLASESDITLTADFTITQPGEQPMNGDLKADLGFIYEGESVYITPRILELQSDDQQLMLAGNMASALLWVYKDQRIQFDTLQAQSLAGGITPWLPGGDVQQFSKQFYELPSIIAQALKDNAIFVTTTEWVAEKYDIVFDKTGLEWFMNTLAQNDFLQSYLGNMSEQQIKETVQQMVWSVQMDAQLHVVKNNDVRLLMNNITFEGDENTSLRGELGAKQWSLTVAGVDQSEFMVEREKEGKSTEFEIAINAEGEEKVKIDGDRSMMLRSNGYDTTIKGDVMISASEVLEMVEDEEITVAFSITTKVDKDNSIAITTPTEFITMEEIFGALGWWLGGWFGWPAVDLPVEDLEALESETFVTE